MDNREIGALGEEKAFLDLRDVPLSLLVADPDSVELLVRRVRESSEGPGFVQAATFNSGI
jgi:hypothetical protein